MPPAGQAGRAILKPGDQSVRDAAGKVTSFAGIPIISDSKKVLEEYGAVIGVYGKGGSGKTTLVCSLADPKINPNGIDAPIGVLDAEAGIKAVAHLLGDNLQDIPCPDFSDVETFIDGWKATPRDAFPWRTLVVDNLSAFVDKILKEQGRHGYKVSPNAPAIAGQPDYGAMTVRVTDALQEMRDLALDYNVNVIILLWEQTEKTEQGVVTGKKADVTPKLATRVQGMLDYVAYLSVEKSTKQRRMLSFAANEAGIELDGKTRRRPDSAAMQIPFKLYYPAGSALMVDLLNTIKRGQPFPASKYTEGSAA